MTTPTDDLAQALRAIVEWQPPTMKDRDGNDCGMALLIGSNGVRDYFRALAAEALVAHESRAQSASVADALNTLENAALKGFVLHGDDVPRFRALVDRIAPAQPASVVDGCKHTGRIIRGTKGKSANRVGSEIAWCENCGQITYCSDATPANGLPSFEKWCDKHILAFSCAHEAAGGEACKSWCGHHSTCIVAPQPQEKAS